MLRLLGYTIFYVLPGAIVAGFVGWHLSSLWAAALVVGLYAICVCLIEAGSALIALDDEMKDFNDQYDKEGQWYDY